MEENTDELSAKRICRFCMTQEEPLTNIYAKDSRLENAVPLPLQIMACVSIEVFNNDGMPNTICSPCRILMDRSYRFKQICKKSDSALRQYPTTGIWPDPIPLPDDIAETIFSPDHRKRHAESESDDSVPSPKRNKTYTELTTVKQKSPKRTMNPIVLNSQSDQGASRVIKIKRKTAVQHENMDQYILKADYSMDEYEEKPIKSAIRVKTDVFPCEHCERSFPLKQLLDIHMRHHTRERKYKCDLCSKRFFSKYDLGKHMSVHSGVRPFTCVACGKTFARATLLHRHEKIHVDTPKFLCNSCDKTFLSLDELDRHESNHKKRRPFSCTQCPKRFAFKQGLERHEVIHAQEKPFNCQYCDEGFTTPGKLARHVTGHAGARPYPCKMCSKSFLLSHHLTRHLKSHTGLAPSATHYKCDECEKVFLRKDDLIYHSAVHATQNLTCPLCKDQFDDIDTVTDHIKSHTEGDQYPCDFCDLIFTSEERLVMHLSNDHSTDCNQIAPVKQELILEENTEQAQEDSYEDPLEILNSSNVTTPNKSSPVKKSIKNKQVETPVRRSQRSGTVKDYAKMAKAGGTSDDSENDKDDEDVSENMKIIKSSQVNVKTYSPSKSTKEPGTRPPGRPRIVKQQDNNKSKSPELIVKRTVKKERSEDPRSQPTRTSVRTKSLILNKSVEEVTTKEDKLTQQNSEIDISPSPAEKPKPTILNSTILNFKNNSEKDITLSPTPVKLTKAQLASMPIPRSEIVQMKIGDKMVKVQKIIMTKSEVEAMAREGKIEMKGGAMLLKQGPKLGKAIAKTIGGAGEAGAADKTAERILPN